MMEKKSDKNASEMLKERDDYVPSDLFDIYDEFKGEVTETKGKITESMFPDSEDLMKEYGIEKSMRVMPHDNNTGGFFIAIFKKHKRTFFTKSNVSGKSEPTDEDEVKALKDLTSGITQPIFENEESEPELAVEKEENKMVEEK